MNKHLFAIVMTTSILLSGCFGTTEEPEEPEPPELSDWDVYYVQSGSELPACGSETLGRLYFVAETTAFEVCTISGWSFVDLTGPAGADGEQGPQGEKGDQGDQGPQGEKEETPEIRETKATPDWMVKTLIPPLSQSCKRIIRPCRSKYLTSRLNSLMRHLAN